MTCEILIDKLTVRGAVPPEWAAALRGLTLTPPPAPQPAPTGAVAEALNEVEAEQLRQDARINAQGELLEKMIDELAELHRLTGDLYRQLVEVRAVKLAEPPAPGPAWEPTPDEIAEEYAAFCAAAPATPPPAVTVTDDPEADLKDGEADLKDDGETHHPAPAPSANGHAPAPVTVGGKLHERRLAVARLIAAQGPQTQKAVMAALTLDDAIVSRTVKGCSWFSKLGGYGAPYDLTDEGREALAAAGFVGVAPAPAETPPPPPVRAPEPGPVELGAKERAAAQCKLIAETIRDSAEPLLPDQIATRTGLPFDLVMNRLMRNGPNALSGGRCYFSNREKHPGCWGLTNSGYELANQEG